MGAAVTSWSGSATAREHGAFADQVSGRVDFESTDIAAVYGV